MSVTAPYHIFFDEINGYVCMEWKGYATSAQFRQGTELMLESVIQNRTGRVLADIKDMVLIGNEDQQWLLHNFLPRAIAAGFRLLCIVTPDNYFNKVAVETVSYKVDKEKLSINFFESLDDAKKMLNDFKEN
ncbi:hypothetical protein [Pollutibacter soli]|uniref:hypothetical protein n=1 Tax=Pollutibacter soli TaxID=3034157 RepID=UPI003013B1D7